MSKTRLSVVVPTRNEQDNIGVLAVRLQTELAPYWNWELVVVDDSSDETPERVRALGADGLPVVLRHRAEHERQGRLASAVLEGFRLARGDILVVMDADLQHPPDRVSLLAEIVAHQGIDIAIGSRFAVGASSSGLSGLGRVACSQGLRWLTRAAIGRARSIRDPLSGFFAIDRRVLASGPDRSDGFKILLDILTYGTWREGVEVPINFGTRLSGDSKASSKEAFALLNQILRYQGARARALGRSTRRPWATERRGALRPLGR